MEQFKNTGFRALGGIMVSFIGISGHEVLKTIILGSMGTVVSFAISALLQKKKICLSAVLNGSG